MKRRPKAYLVPQLRDICCIAFWCIAYPARYFSVTIYFIDYNIYYKNEKCLLKTFTHKNTTNVIKKPYYTKMSEFSHTFKYELFKRERVQVCIPEKKPPTNTILFI